MNNSDAAIEHVLLKLAANPKIKNTLWMIQRTHEQFTKLEKSGYLITVLNLFYSGFQ